MTDQSPIRPGGMPRASSEAERIIAAHMTAAWAVDKVTPQERQAYEISASIIAAYYVAARQNRHVALTTIDHILELSGREMPDAAPFWGNMQNEADEWVEWASESQLAAMLKACLTTLHRKPLALPGPQKKSIAALWNSLAPDDRKAFLAHVTKDATA